MSTGQRPERRFHELIVRAFAELGFEVEQEPRAQGSQRRPDLRIKARNGDGATTVVELKFFRARRVSAELIIGAAELLADTRAEFNADYAVLITTARVDDLLRARFSKHPELFIIDYDGLAELLQGEATLADEFERLVRETSMLGSDSGDRVQIARESVLGSIQASQNNGGRAPAAPPLRRQSSPERGRGAALCRELKAITSAKPGASNTEKNARARKFEAKCIECLMFLFSDSLAAPAPQKRSHKGRNIIDYIARLQPATAFWNLLLSDFGARYIVFEFKHYRKRITQGQILTTEKYLYLAARRPVAIIISLLGPDSGASEAARGALREHGKLILNLTVEDLCVMLHAKDAAMGDGESGLVDVEKPLFDALDEMLMRIDR